MLNNFCKKKNWHVNFKKTKDAIFKNEFFKTNLFIKKKKEKLSSVC